MTFSEMQRIAGDYKQLIAIVSNVVEDFDLDDIHEIVDPVIRRQVIGEIILECPRFTEEQVSGAIDECVTEMCQA